MGEDKSKNSNNMGKGNGSVICDFPRCSKKYALKTYEMGKKSNVSS